MLLGSMGELPARQQQWASSAVDPLFCTGWTPLAGVIGGPMNTKYASFVSIGTQYNNFDPVGTQLTIQFLRCLQARFLF